MRLGRIIPLPPAGAASEFLVERGVRGEPARVAHRLAQPFSRLQRSLPSVTVLPVIFDHLVERDHTTEASHP